MILRKVILRLAPLLALGLLYAAGLGMRRAVLLAQYEALGESPPYTLESALFFRRIQQVLETGRLPWLDTSLQYPEGVLVAESDTVGAERVYAAMVRRMPQDLPLIERVRWADAAWFCLGIPLLVLWVRWAGGSWPGGFVAGGFYAVAISAVIRSTGQELLHENFALPLLIGHLAFGALARSARGAAGRWLAALASATLLAGALMSWDLVQFYLLLWLIASAFSLLPPRPDKGRDAFAFWCLHLAALLAAGLWNPYLRAHGFVASPLMGLAFGLLLARLTRPWWSRAPRRSVAPALLLLAGPLVLAGLGAGYRDSYSHFADLLMAKLLWVNRKPEDPSGLTFEQRIMWVPGLNSATWSMVSRLFPLLLPLTFLAGAVCLLKKSYRSGSAQGRLWFFFTATLTAFVFFARFHVYLALFTSAILGGWAARSEAAGRTWRHGRVLRWSVTALLLAGLGGEAAHTLEKPERWGRGPVYYKEMKELTDWLARHVQAEPVLANFGISAAILTYGHCPVILHPKFESREMRERVREYGEKLFKGTEREFRDWADNLGARYYVYARGEFSSVEPTRQMRYFVNAMDPPEWAAARLLEFRPQETTRFRPVWENRKYRVFRIQTRAEEARSRVYGEEAQSALERGELTRAEERATAALMLNPGNEAAQQVLRHVGSLKDSGFGAANHEP